MPSNASVTHLVTEGGGVEHGGGDEGEAMLRVGEGEAVGGDGAINGEGEARGPLQGQGGTW